MVVYKVEADYNPEQIGLRTEAGPNGIEYVVADRLLAEEIAEQYVLLSEERNNVEWIETGDGTYELATSGSDEPMRLVHARIDEVQVRDEMPEMWSADERQQALEDANA